MDDKPWRETTEPIFLVFDALMVNGKNLISSPFDKRLSAANEYLKQRVSLHRVLKKKGDLKSFETKFPNIP